MPRLAIVVKGYPRLSETFIAQEILALEERGLDILIVSLRHPTDSAVHGLHRRIRAEVLYLPEYLKDDPARVAQARRHARTLPNYGAAERLYRADLARDRSASRHRRWGQAQVLARELPDDVSWLHSHYLHTPASVTRYAAALRGLGWSFSAHAKDIWTTPDWELAEKIADAAWGVTCTAANLEKLAGLDHRGGRVSLQYHGLARDRFPDPPVREPGAGGAKTILSVARLVEKKGFDDLLRALARLPADLDWRFEHVGGGPLLSRLQALASRLGIADRIVWHGARAQEEVIEAYARADLFVLPSRVARNGDRDGLPNVLMEAQRMGVACVATRVSAIPELIEDGSTGLLVPQRDPEALAVAVERLLRDDALRARLARAGRHRVETEFAGEKGFDHLAGLLARACEAA